MINPQTAPPSEPALLDAQVHSALDANPYLGRRRLRVETHDRRVVLKGVVGTYYQKQMAQESILRLDGVDQVENCLEVNWA